MANTYKNTMESWKKYQRLNPNEGQDKEHYSKEGYYLAIMRHGDYVVVGSVNEYDEQKRVFRIADIKAGDLFQQEIQEYYDKYIYKRGE